MTESDEFERHRDWWGKRLCMRVAPSTRRLCRRTRHPWPADLLGMPDPQSCRSHWTPEEVAAHEAWRPSPPKRSREEIRAEEDAWEVKRAALEPACWSWPVPGETVLLLARYHEAEARDDDLADYVGMLSQARRLYDQGRCAVCGLLGNEIEDHDHETGLVRGWLCRSCNTAEGMNRFGGGVWTRYRQRYPYLILGIEEPYSGWGWEDGRPVGYGAGEWPPAPEDRPRDNAMRGAFT